jgi:hypothetical protein
MEQYEPGLNGQRSGRVALIFINADDRHGSGPRRVTPDSRNSGLCLMPRSRQRFAPKAIAAALGENDRHDQPVASARMARMVCGLVLST